MVCLHENVLRPGVLNAVEEFKFSVFRDGYEESRHASNKASDASKKRKEMADKASEMSTKYNWAELAENGKVERTFLSDLIFLICK